MPDACHYKVSQNNVEHNTIQHDTTQFNTKKNNYCKNTKQLIINFYDMDIFALLSNIVSSKFWYLTKYTY